MDHSKEPLLAYRVSARSQQTTGPIPEFLAKKAAEQAPKTAVWYREALMQFWTFVESQDLTTVGDFSEMTVNLWRKELRRRGVSDNTIAGRLRALKAFSRWMATKGWTPTHVLADLKAPQTTKPQFDLIPDDVRRRLFALYDQDTYLGSRNLAILAVLSDTGMRREEVANLLLKNVDLDAQVVKVYADKTEEWRYIPLSDEVVAMVRNYLKWRGRYFAQPARKRRNGDQNHRRHVPREIRSDRLFLSWDGETISPDGLGHILQRARQKLGFRIHAHLFRHDWITRKALDGESPSVVRRWAGHKSFLMTDYYFGLAEEMLGAIKPKRSTLASISVPGMKRRGRPAKISN
ncbi:MAG: tyrosine-type recombinase/integrase [Dehalococcoidia bacterium]